jgi:L-asparaginase
LKITLLLTGGTIGIQKNGSVLDVSEDKTPQLLKNYKKAHPNGGLKFSCENLFNVLSENMTLSHWKQMYDKIKTISKKDCDGIIISHGTDTLAYTATFLSFILKEVSVPILLISSNYPIEHEMSNGLCNFIASVDFITKIGTKGVFVPFCTNGKTDIHLGSRLLQSQPFVHCFSSLGNVIYGKMNEGEFEWNIDKNNPTPEQIEKRSDIIISRFPDEKRVLYLKPYFGIDYSILRFKNKPDAILHGLYHSGTACVTPEFENNSIISFAEHCLEQGIDFYAAPCDSQHSMYSTSKEMEEAGIKFIKNISCVAAYTKLLIAYGAFSDATEREKFIFSNIACEEFYQ